MEEKNRMSRWIITILMLLITFVIFAGSLLPYLRIDLSGVIELLPEQIAGIFNEVTELLGSEQGKISFSAATLLRLTAGLGRDTAAADILSSFGLIILLPYIMYITAAGFSLVRRLWSYIITMLFSLAGIIMAILGVTILIPSSIYRAIPVSFLKISEIAGLEFGEKFLREQIMESVGIAWWMCIAGGLGLTVFSIAGIIVSRKRKEKDTAWMFSGTEDTAAIDFLEDRRNDTNSDEMIFSEEKLSEATVPETDKVMGISCGFGELNGVEIPLSENETITIGTNSARCNVVVSEPGIDAVHCRIHYSRERDCYQVRDLSQSGVYIDSRRMNAGSTVWLPSGTILFLAGKYAIGLL